MKHIETYELILPEFVICPLEYGIADMDMDEEDVRAYNKTVETINNLLDHHEDGVHFTLEYANEAYFSHNNDITRQGGNVVDTKLHIWKE